MLVSSFYSTFAPRKTQVNVRRINRETQRAVISRLMVVPVPKLVLADGKRVIGKRHV